MASLTDKAKAVAVSALCSALFNFTPNTVENGDVITVTFTDAQAATVRAALEKWMSAAPGNFRIELLPIVKPLILQKAAPWLLGASAVGGILGRLL